MCGSCGHARALHAEGRTCSARRGGDGGPCECLRYQVPPQTPATCVCGHPLAWHVATACHGEDAVHGACRCREYATRATPPVEHDVINAPAHYTRFPAGVEPIALAEHLTYNIGAAVKYLARAGFKHDAIEDLRKAIWHVERELARLAAAANR